MYHPIKAIFLTIRCLKKANDQSWLYPVNQKDVEKRVRMQLILCVKKISRLEFRASKLDNNVLTVNVPSVVFFPYTKNNISSAPTIQ